MSRTDNALQKGFAIQGKQNTYVIDHTLGQGTFGITYLAKYKTKIKGEMGVGQVNVQVAIKEFFMKEWNLRDAETSSLHDDSSNIFFERYRFSFIREAHKMAKLTHPNITHVFEVIEANNTAYIVMEFIEGGNLDDYIRQRGHLDEQEALNLFLQIAHAIEYMHSKRMLHLDLKPKNIMLDEDGRCHIIDFGLSKEYDEEGEAESDTSLGLGTPGYAPIEQCERQDGGIFAATIDIYALGGTLYKMLTGTTPPKASQVLASPDLIASRLSSHGISRQTIQIIEQAMQPAARNRFKTVGEMIDALNVDPSITIKKIVDPIPDPKPDTPVDPKKPGDGPETFEIKLPKKWILSAVICLACALLTFVGIQYGPNIFSGNGSSDNEELVTDSIAPIDTTVVKTPPTTSPGNNTSDKPTSSGTSTGSGTSGPKITFGTLDLGYATWNGSIRNGTTPHGQGTMTYKESCPLKDRGTHIAEPGDIVVGEQKDGHWVDVATMTSESQDKPITLYFF